MLSKLSCAPTQKQSVKERLLAIEQEIDALLPHCDRKISERTRRQYLDHIERMKKRGLKPEEIARSPASYGPYRAAKTYEAMCAFKQAYDRLRQFGDRLPEDFVDQMFAEIEAALDILAEYPPNPPGRLKKARMNKGKQRVKKGKRLGLNKLPRDWREQMIEAFPAGSTYHAAVLVSALVGLRPQELANGVIASITKNFHLRIMIEGAKVTKITGQPIRELWLTIDNDVAWLLASAIELNFGELLIKIDCPKRFSDAVRSMSRRLFPQAGYIASQYSFRHAFAADQKKKGVSREVLAKMMGHVSARSAQAYGVAKQSRGQLSDVLHVTASRPVRRLRDAPSLQVINVSMPPVAPAPRPNLGDVPGYF